MPAYDGGLFKPANHPFLEQHRVGDLHLRKAIDLLARTRDPKTGTPVVVDYRDLEIRHLGSIYEGLLEYQVRVASEPLVVRKVKGKEVVERLPLTPSPTLPLRGGGSQSGGGGSQSGADILPGQVYLVTDKGERKPTGSYYTPDYIVQYIVEHSERIYVETVRKTTEKARLLADLWISRHFGLAIADDVWQPLTKYLLHGGFALQGWNELIAQGKQIAAERRFFHWELEFPEVFFDQHGRLQGDAAGFDAVIGNPPYVRQELLALFKPYFESTFRAYYSTADLYLYFYKQGIRLLSESGRLAYISSGTFARGKFAAPFRSLLPTIAQLESIIDFGENQPFDGAEMVRPSIVVMRKGQVRQSFRSLFISEAIPNSLDLALTVDGVDCSAESLERSEWVFQAGKLTGLAQRILQTGISLSEVVDGHMYRGLTTGLNEMFLIDDITASLISEDDQDVRLLIRPAVQGQDLRPWYQENMGRWLIVLPSGWTKAVFGKGLSEEAAWQKVTAHHQALAKHLHPCADAARKRYDQGEYWWELRACDYYNAFDQPKIFWPDISKLPRFSWDETGKYINNTGYIMPSTDPALLDILQSRVTWFAVSQICQPLRLRAGLWQYRVLPQFASRLPIPEMPSQASQILRSISVELSHDAGTRYDLHQQSRHRIATDLGVPDTQLNQKLTTWWELDFPALRSETKKVFKRDIPLKQRDEWESWLAEQRAEHERLTAEIVRLETELNARVYELFDLTPAEIKIIEESTKYRYGEA